MMESQWETPILRRIHSLEDYKALKREELYPLAQEIRARLVDVVSKNGGHLASNLGAVELTMALDWVFDSPADKLVFDVGHQSYVHKLLTGRDEVFPTLRREGGLSGFPKREESIHDAFNTGHASTSISAALGMLRAMALCGDCQHHAVALIGDGALTGGLAFEALNDGGQSGLPLIVLLNDNGMSIAKNVGAMALHLSKVRASKRYNDIKRSTIRFLEHIPGIGRGLYGSISRFKERVKYFLLPNVLFEEMGFTYLGPIDGHDLDTLIRVLENARELRSPVVIHAVTKKGKGYLPAESSPDKFHGVGAFDPETGSARAGSTRTNSDVFGATLCKLAEADSRIVAITAAMRDGTGLQEFSCRYPRRFFDVGIAEQHAVTLAAGMAAQGLRPVVAIYSSFLQRAYDQVLHDVGLQGLPVVFAIDRAGLVGEDGETHQGVYDLAYLQTIPGLDIFAPSSQEELSAALALALAGGRPAALRYPRGSLMSRPRNAPLLRGKWELLRPLRPVTIVAAGKMVQIGLEALSGLDAGLVNAWCIRPMDMEMVGALAETCRTVLSLEDGLRTGGLGSRLCEALQGTGVRILRIGVGDVPVAQASAQAQFRSCGMDADTLRALLKEELEAEGR